MPNFDSYERLRDEEWAALGWGKRSTGNRQIKKGDWELRHVDGTAHPHLTMLVTAGLLGVEAEGVGDEGSEDSVAERLGRE
jgi:glutamine synthetase